MILQMASAAIELPIGEMLLQKNERKAIRLVHAFSRESFNNIVAKKNDMQPYL